MERGALWLQQTKECDHACTYLTSPRYYFRLYIQFLSKYLERARWRRDRGESDRLIMEFARLLLVLAVHVVSTLFLCAVSTICVTLSRSCQISEI